MIKTNVGPLDRILRAVAGIVLLSLFFLYPEAPWRWFTLIGVVPLLTAALGTCPLYTILGLSTCPVRKA